MIIFAERLTKTRIKCNMTEEDVAHEIGVSLSNIYDYESNIFEPSLTHLRQICIKLHVSADYLLGLKDE